MKQRDLEWKRELERRDKMWRDELKQRDQAYWKGHCKRDEKASKVLEGRVMSLKIIYFLSIFLANFWML